MITVKEKVLNNISEMIYNLEKIKISFENDVCPGNEEWTAVAEPLNEIVNMLNQAIYSKIKDKPLELLTISKWQQKKKNYQDGEISQREIFKKDMKQ